MKNITTKPNTEKYSTNQNNVYKGVFILDVVLIIGLLSGLMTKITSLFKHSNSQFVLLLFFLAGLLLVRYLLSRWQAGMQYKSRQYAYDKQFYASKTSGQLPQDELTKYLRANGIAPTFKQSFFGVMLQVPILMFTIQMAKELPIRAVNIGNLSIPIGEPNLILGLIIGIVYFYYHFFLNPITSRPNSVVIAISLFVSSNLGNVLFQIYLLFGAILLVVLYREIKTPTPISLSVEEFKASYGADERKDKTMQNVASKIKVPKERMQKYGRFVLFVIQYEFIFQILVLSFVSTWTATFVVQMVFLLVISLIAIIFRAKKAQIRV